MKNLLIISVFSVSSLFSIHAIDSKTFTFEQKTEIETIIHNYILNNPEILKQAIEVLQEREYAKMQTKAVDNIVKQAPKVFASNSPIIGNKDGKLNIVEFMDYNCLHCRQIHNTLGQLVSENKDLKLVIKQYPVLGEASVFAAKAALAAEKQGKFVELHHAFMSEKVKLNNANILDIAKDVGLDISLLQEDMKKVEPELIEVRNLAMSIGIQATPALIVATYPIKDNKKVIFIPGAVEKPILEKAIESVK